MEALELADPALLALRSATERLLAENDARVTQEAALAGDAAARARWIAWLATGLSVAGAILLGGILWISISGPLRRLTKGTQELARGRFEHRIEDRSRSEFGTLARDFNLMAERLDELEELKRDFVSHVSHELKGPLAAVQETILVLLEEIPGPLTDRQRYLLELSQGSAARLSRMISDLLEISRLEAGATLYNPAPVHLTELVRAHLTEVEPLVEERGLSVTLENLTGGKALGDRAVADADRIHDVIANLVGNAVKFSPTKGSIHIVLEASDEVPTGLPSRYRALDARESGPFLLVSVEDEGPGVAEEHREGIFEKFHQVSLNERKQGQGVGLGLAISRRIVEAHGGAIWVDEGRSGGARFQVLVPVYPSRWPELADSLTPGSGGESQASPSPGADPSPRPGSTTVHA
jgi:signal transduction histidine kinase